MPEIHCEQVVYGSFPFWDRGYALLARSPGCRPEWLSEFQAACQRYGEPPTGSNGAPALFSLRLPSGVWAVVGVGPQGADDRGRPGALAFHGLLVPHIQFARIGFDPFLLAGILRRDWTAETTSLPLITHRTEEIAPATASEQITSIVRALTRRRRVAVESAEPIEDLARDAWRALPRSVRRRASVATLAFSSSNAFDLLALPKLTRQEEERSYLSLDAADTVPASPRFVRLRGARTILAAAGLVALAVLAATSIPWKPPASNTGETAAREGLSEPFTRALALPDPDGFRDIDPEERTRVVEALLDLAERFGLAADLDMDERADPARLMTQLADDLRYRGPWLSDSEREALRRRSGPEAKQALEWDAHLQRFAPLEKPLAVLAGKPLGWQVRVLARSVGVEPHPDLAPSEVPFAIGEALSVPWPVRPSPLASSYPQLADYARFLGRLPRR